MGVGGGGDACFSMREEGTTAERLRGTRQKREKQREAACCKHLAGGGKGREEQRTKEEEERKELPACILIKCISLLVMLEHSSELGFVGRVCVDATCCLPPAAAGAGSMRADELLLRYTLARTRICAHTYNNEHASTSF